MQTAVTLRVRMGVKSRLHFLLVILVFLLVLLSSCKKNKLQSNIKLKDKPLSEIRKHIQGNWQIHYSYGGITGHIRHNYTNSFVEFRPDDIIYWKDNKIEIVNTKINWIRMNDLFGELTYIMVFDSFSWSVDGIRNDTLILYDNTSEPMTHYLTRK